VDESLRLARDLLEGLGEAVFSEPRWRLLEIGATGVTKATTLALLAAEHGLGPDDVVAFGDMPNDVPMLRWAGRGYAMGGGHPEAIAAADAVAPPCDEDGVAQVLESLLAAARTPR
jgi:hydroxymethylpyrimidine pyrophosphatase-like HAD family hydrolase